MYMNVCLILFLFYDYYSCPGDGIVSRLRRTGRTTGSHQYGGRSVDPVSVVNMEEHPSAEAEDLCDSL
jgi:hypothetical protein